MTAVIAAIVAGSASITEAHVVDPLPEYLNAVISIEDYQRTPYAGYDLVRVQLSVENLEEYRMDGPLFALGGYLPYEVENATVNIPGQFDHSSYADVRGRGGSVSEGECTSPGRFVPIAPGETGETHLCFMADRGFVAEGLLVSEPVSENQLREHELEDGLCWLIDFRHDSHSCIEHKTQIVPFSGDSAYCLDRRSLCNVDNVQPVPGGYTPEPVELLHVLYFNDAGTLVVVFDGAVVASDASKIDLIYDIDAYIKNGTAANLGDAELRTVGGERRSPVLAFGLSDELHQAIESPDELALVVNPRAIYAAEGFADYTKPNGYDQVLVTDVTVVR